MFQPSAPLRRSAAAPTTFATFRGATSGLSGAQRAAAFDQLSALEQASLWCALGDQCASRNERDRTRASAAPWPRPASDYADYLRSAAWRERAASAKARAGGRCRLCGDSEGQLEAHHISYARVGSERAEDLTVLCAGCHRTFHDRRALAEKRRLGRAGSSLREAA